MGTDLNTYTIAAIPGDGIGQEVINAGVEVLNALADKTGDFSLEITDFPWGTDYYLEHGVMMPDDALKQLRPFDAIYFDGSAPSNWVIWCRNFGIWTVSADRE